MGGHHRLHSLPRVDWASTLLSHLAMGNAASEEEQPQREQRRGPPPTPEAAEDRKMSYWEQANAGYQELVCPHDAGHYASLDLYLASWEIASRINW